MLEGLVPPKQPSQEVEKPTPVRFYGRIVRPGEKDRFPDVLLGDEHAIFNAATWSQTIHGQERTFSLPRVMAHAQKPGVTDATDRFDFLEWKHSEDSTNIVTRALQHIPVDVIRGDSLYNPEDARALVDQESKQKGKVLFGLTAASDKGVPYPAFFSAQYPFDKEHITPMEVLSYLPAGKNLLPLSEDRAIYRPEHTKEGEVNGLNFLFIQKNGDMWEEMREIQFPYVDWVANRGRFGLTGGEKIPTGQPGIFRMVFHGSENLYENGIVTYSLGLAECREREDKTFDVLAIDNKPLLTYKQAVAYAGIGVEPDPAKQVIYSVGYTLTDKEVLIPVALFDREIVLFGFSREEMLRPFSKRQDTKAG